MTDPLKKAYAGKRVFVTGHTGFKGSWLCEWLLGLGAQVYGYSLPPPTRPALFQQLGLSRRLHHTVGNVLDAGRLNRAFRAARPHYLFHLAAQPIVRSAHALPGPTWSTNVMGTVNVLEALRLHGRTCAAVIVTTDKVYGGKPTVHGEEDPLQALDPYGASKAAADLATRAWRESFGLKRIATARSGNVIGGGDWARDRLVPDCVRALSAGRRIVVRCPAAVRPWQHVLDPLHGYLLLGAALGSSKGLKRAAGALNFGPSASDHRSVQAVVEAILSQWPGRWERRASGPKETHVLRLDASQARRSLGWRPAWRFGDAVTKTVEWYREARTPVLARRWTRCQIKEFEANLQ